MTLAIRFYDVFLITKIAAEYKVMFHGKRLNGYTPVVLEASQCSAMPRNDSDGS